MQKIKSVIASSISGGLFTLLPILLVLLLLMEIFDLLIALATPLADLLFSPELADQIKAPLLMAIVLLMGSSLLLGLLAKTAAGKKFGLWLEEKTIGRLDMYKAVKRLILGFSGADGDRAFIPGLLNADNGDQDLIYIIEEHGNGKLTIMIPWAPAAFAGNIKIVDAEKVTLVDSNIGEYSKILSHWGVGMPDILARKKEQAE